MKMKKILALLLLIVLIFTFVGCGSDTDEEDISIDLSNYTIDYTDAKSFEEALNDGAEVKGKVVQFDVVEYKPDSSLGINCWSGEHLNFISKEELDVKKGSIVVGYITKEPTKSLGSWKISYEVLEIDGYKVNANASSSTPEDNQPASKKITVTMSEDELKNLSTTEAENKLKEMGFIVFKYDTVSAGDKKDLDGKISAVEIKNGESGTGDFKVGDTYETDAIVVLWSYKYTKTEDNKTNTSSGSTSSTPSSGQTSTVSPSISTTPSVEMVWIPQKNGKYHKKASCSGMKDPIQITKQEAINRGYDPCGKCY